MNSPEKEDIDSDSGKDTSSGTKAKGNEDEDWFKEKVDEAQNEHKEINDQLGRGDYEMGGEGDHNKRGTTATTPTGIRKEPGSKKKKQKTSIP